MNNHGLSPIVRLFYQAAAALKLTTSEKLQRIVIASEAKQSRLYINQQIRDCHVAYAPRNDTPKRFFQWSQLTPKFLTAQLWRGLLVISIVAACLLSHTMTVYAFPVNQCAGPRYGENLNCTAGDVSITGMRIVGDTTSCIGETNITVDLEITVNFAVPDRWDIGIFISNDGKSPQLLPASGGAASCSVGILPPSSPFLNLDGPTDTCGDGNKDIGGGTGSGLTYMTNVTVSCQALTGSGGNLYIPFVVSWDNQKTPPGAICTSIADPVPNTKSKCNAPTIAQGTVSVVVLPTITNSDGITTIKSGNTTNYTVVITNTTGDTLTNAVFNDPAVTGINVNSVTCAGAACPCVSCSVAAMQGAGITIPSMPVGSSVTFTINATLTGNPGDTRTNTASVTVGGKTNSASDTDTIVGDIAILPTSSSKYGSPGTLVVHNYTLYNFSGSAANISLSALSNQGWTVQLSTSSVTLPETVGSSANFTVTVTAGAPIGTVDVTTITATSGSNTATATAVTTVSSPLTLTPTPLYGSGGKVSSVFYDHRVQNNTASSQTVTFSTVLSGTCTGGWTAIPPATVTLAAFGGYKDIVVQVNIPSGALLTDVCIAETTASAGTTASAIDTTTVKNLVLYSEGGYTKESYIFPTGNDVYARAYGTLAATTYKFCWYDSSNALRRTSTIYTGPGILSDTYLTLPNTPLGTWIVEVQQKSAAQACNLAPNSTYFAQSKFYVGPDHLNASYTYAGANPSVNSNVTIDLALHDRSIPNHVVPLDPSSGNVVQGNPPTTKDPLKITVTVSGSATITEYCNPTCTAITPAQTVTFNLNATTGTATITITDTARETVTITPSSYNSALYGSSLTPTRDESTTVTFVRRRMRILDWREVQ